MSLKDKIKNAFIYKEKKHYDFILPESYTGENKQDVSPDQDLEELNIKEEENKQIYPSLKVNLEYMKVRYNTLINSDIKIREFTINVRNKQYDAFIMYIDGMTDSQLLNDFVLKPLMLRNKSNTYDKSQDKVVSEAITSNITVRKIKKFNLIDYIYSCLVPQNDIEKVEKFSKIISGINEGNCALFIDTINYAFNIDAKSIQQRSIENPSNEMVIKGSQESFVEVIRTNTSILRRLVNNEKLIIENTTVGKFSKTKCAICYIKNIANNDLVAEVKYRINNLEIDYLFSSGQLEQLIEDKGAFSLPQIISTERPDRATKYLLQGRVVVILNGTPYVLIMPTTLVDLLSSPEDDNLKFQFANLLKFIRILATIITVLLPGMYVAITNYHQELIPTELLFSIVASREYVPFPTIFEIVIMEGSFELIREAGLRIPSPIGSTIGIVGGLILGQAAVDANIVSPILIIVVAITGISSFAIPDFSLGFYFRISRFIYIVLGYLLGFLGIGAGIFINLILLCNIKSFGVSYLTSFIPSTKMHHIGYFATPMWKRENRPNFLNTKASKMQEHISMKWKKEEI